MKKRRMRRAAFTLIEVMIVLAIVLALSTLVGIAVFARRDQAKVNFAEIDLNNIQSAMEQFRFDFERYPTDEEGIAVLWNSELLDAESDTEKYTEYLQKPMPNDRWGNEWGYRAESETREGKYDLWSNGPDGEEGTEDDITSWAAFEDDDNAFGSPAGMPAGAP